MTPSGTFNLRTGKVKLTSEGMARYQNNISTNGVDGCAIWVGMQDVDGYGKMTIGNKGIRAHRLTWMMHFGKIPEGLGVLHRCDVPLCQNKKHLFLGTSTENANDRHQKKREAKGTAHGMSRLTPEKVIEIRNRLKSQSLSKVAKIIGVSKSCIAHVNKRRVWDHVL